MSTSFKVTQQGRMVTQHGYCSQTNCMHTEKYPHPELNRGKTKCNGRKETKKNTFTRTERSSAYVSTLGMSAYCIPRRVCLLNFDKMDASYSYETSVSTNPERLPPHKHK